MKLAFIIRLTKRCLALSLVGLLWPHLLPTVAYADDAVVLPKGNWRMLADSQFYLPFDKRFNKDGNVEDIASDFNTELSSKVFPDLALVEAGFGLPSGFASFGKSEVTQKWHAKKVIFQPTYGLTDRLSIGMNIPYWWIRNDVSARLDNTTATVGFNPLVPGGVAPIGFAGTPPPTTEDIQNLLTSKGFKRVQSFSYSGIGDLEAGFRYQYHRSDMFRHAVTMGARFPTGRKDDPDDLMDTGVGDGAYAILIHSNHDFMLQPDGPEKTFGFPTPGSFLLNTTFRYAYFIPDKEKLRVCSIHNPICTNEDSDVRRKIGDNIEAEISPKLGLLKGVIGYSTFKYAHKFKDHYAGDKGFEYGALSTQSDFNEYVYIVGLTFTSIPWFIEKMFPLPLVASVSYRDRFAGDNNIWKHRFIGFSLAVYF